MISPFRSRKRNRIGVILPSVSVHEIICTGVSMHKIVSTTKPSNMQCGTWHCTKYSIIIVSNHNHTIHLSHAFYTKQHLFLL